MSLAEFYALVAAFVTLSIIIVVLPMFISRGNEDKDKLTNTQLVKGRLKELDREVREGVLSAEDKPLAEKEVKIALVQEEQEKKPQSDSSWIALVSGAVLAIATGAAVYFNVNHIGGVEDKAQAPQNLKILSAKLLDTEAAEDIKPEDIQKLALAIRLRLKDEPDDSQGWMFLGRLRMTLGQLDESIAAYERSLRIRPDSTMTRLSYAQALMMTNADEQLRKARNEIETLLTVSPDNDNLSLMMAVTSAQLGDLELANTYYLKIKDKLGENNPMRVSLESRLGELRNDDAQIANTDALSFIVDIADPLKEKLPSSGFLLVFARQGESTQGMPIAVKRQAIGEFPVAMTLSDVDAMVPELSLSKFDSVNLTARVSTTPDVSAQPGDFEGTLKIDSRLGGIDNYTIEINKEVQ